MNAPGRAPQCVSNLLLDEWLAGELAPEQRAEVERHVADCASCGARRDQRVRAAERFLHEAPSFAAHAARFGAAAAGGAKTGGSEDPPLRRWARRGALVALPLAAAAAALVAFLPRAPVVAPLDETRSKGSARIDYFVKRGELVTRGAQAGALRPGDLLRFTYSIDRPAYLALVDVDQSGARVYFPAGAARAAAIAAGADVALDFSVELDETPGDERVYAVFCPQPFELEPLRRQLAARSTAAAPAGCAVYALVLRKAGSR
jgi:hypothetical protein